ncbi:HisA/HisF-related TIM barrel protein [Paraburkholderia sp.]|uniref:HisA/HisF-related TIM barrel protein n=1 Tax=Paraburkholderia sp. TaxID=1926495 RepID=UPI002384F9A3|nr:HisA/HisF-related TIM barrel protein [Paraburkholderia sp.]MDE1179172.1 HisA/HisF-related TIM barrel protein [Paraburkholderia sp.]
MQVIPVLDLLDNHAVRAVRGERASYRPIQSSLCATSDPLVVARALLAATGARMLYIADLGAIVERRAHIDVLARLCIALGEPAASPTTPVEIWLDAGFADLASMHALFACVADRVQQRMRDRIATPDCRAASLVPVFGSESLDDIDAPRAAESSGLRPVLSLDHRGGQLLATDVAHRAALLDSTHAWPSRLIAMTLDQVGAYEGPDLALLSTLRARAGNRSVIGAGGIRNDDDLHRATQSGATAWLVASAVHDGRLNLSAGS